MCAIVIGTTLHVVESLGTNHTDKCLSKTQASDSGIDTLNTSPENLLLMSVNAL